MIMYFSKGRKTEERCWTLCLWCRGPPFAGVGASEAPRLDQFWPCTFLLRQKGYLVYRTRDSAECYPGEGDTETNSIVKATHTVGRVLSCDCVSFGLNANGYVYCKRPCSTR
jgi:hypothetical protein